MNPDAVPCPHCKEPLNSKAAKQCFECGMDWHDAQKVFRHRRLFAAGDIHGCDRALSALLAAIAPCETDTFVILGDYVDRGPGTRQVLEMLLDLRRKATVIPLLGNHEELMLAARNEISTLGTWMSWGGDRTLDSYREAGKTPSLDSIPSAHWDFIAACRHYYETELFIFSHGLPQHDLSMDGQDAKALQWNEFKNPRPHVSGKTVVCGHTEQRSGMPSSCGQSVCLDTKAVAGGWLSAMELGSRRVIQANQEGVVRRFGFRIR